MGTICIFLGLIIFICSVGGGFLAARALMNSTLAVALASLNPGTVYLVMVAVCGFIGFLIMMNLVMHGLTYNKICKLAKSVKSAKSKKR